MHDALADTEQAFCDKRLEAVSKAAAKSRAAVEHHRLDCGQQQRDVLKVRTSLIRASDDCSRARRDEIYRSFKLIQKG